MAAQQNIFRTLKLIRLLKQRPGKTLTQLAQILDCDPRHARRYMETLEEAGYCIDKEGKRPPRFYIFEDERKQQANFTEEEAQLVQLALAALPDSNPLLVPLRQKIYQHSTLLPLANNLADLHQSQVVAQLAQAIRDRRQVQLFRYYSANSNSVSDRLIEPHGFSDHYTQIMAYEPESVTVKTFKIQRIEAVEVLEIAQTQPPAEVPTDPFDWPGDPVRISLGLTQMAHRLLIEEHPLTRPDIRSNLTDKLFSHTYIGTVRSWVGVGRFVLGLPGQVRIESPAEFRAYVERRINEFSP